MSTLSLQEALIPSTNFPVFLPCGGVQRRRSPTVLFAASRSKQAKHATAGKARPSLACVVSPPSYTYRCQPYGTRTEQHTKLYPPQKKKNTQNYTSCGLPLLASFLPLPLSEPIHDAVAIRSPASLASSFTPSQPNQPTTTPSNRLYLETCVRLGLLI